MREQSHRAFHINNTTVEVLSSTCNNRGWPTYFVLTIKLSAGGQAKHGLTTGRSRWLLPTYPGSARGFFPLKGSFSFHCRKVLAQMGLFDHWGLLCIIVLALPYNIRHLEATAVVIFCYIYNCVELNNKFVLDWKFQQRVEEITGLLSHLQV